MRQRQESHPEIGPRPPEFVPLSGPLEQRVPELERQVFHLRRREAHASETQGAILRRLGEKEDHDRKLYRVIADLMAARQRSKSTVQVAGVVAAAVVGGGLAALHVSNEVIYGVVLAIGAATLKIQDRAAGKAATREVDKQCGKGESDE